MHCLCRGCQPAFSIAIRVPSGTGMLTSRMPFS
jgi:hypothetical protein